MAKRLLFDNGKDEGIVSYEPSARYNMLCLNYLVSRRKYHFNSAIDTDNISIALRISDNTADNSINHRFDEANDVDYLIVKKQNKVQRTR